MLLLYVYLFFCGACLGSFITCWAERTCVQLPIGGRQRSRCPNCQHPLRSWQLLPIIGVSLQRGRCWDCRTPISLRSTWVELGCGGLFVLSYQPTWSALPLLFGYGALLFNSLTDYLTRNVYPITLPLPALIGLYYQWPTLDSDLLILIVLLISLYLLARWTHKFGMGDVEVLVMLSCLAPPTVVISSLALAALAALVTLVFSPPRYQLPFVPYLTWGFVMCTQLLNG